jgi:cysteine desulfurase
VDALAGGRTRRWDVLIGRSTPAVAWPARASHTGRVRRHYLDHASTAPLRPEAHRAMLGALELAAGGHLGDPGRIHAEGHTARDLIETARDQVAGFLDVRPRQVVLTSGATEAINAAVWGATRARPQRPVILADVEHSAVRQSSARLAPVRAVEVSSSGRIDPDAVEAALQAAAVDGGPAALVHCQLANHEVGTVQPVAAIAELCRRFGVPLHVDAAAGAGHLALHVDELGADLVSVSAHKLGGPPGAGCLVVRRGLRIEPLLVGGDQERARRAGLEDVIAIAGFGAAAEALAEPGRLAGEAAAQRTLTNRLVADATAVDGIGLLGAPDAENRLPHLVCLAVDGVEAEPVLLALDQAGIAAHSGSSCASEALAPSPVLAAMGVDAERSLRLSVGWSTTADDITAFAAAFGPAVARLRALRG